MKPLNKYESSYFYEPILCSICGEKDRDFMKHKNNQSLTCTDCVNEMLREEIELNEEKYEGSTTYDIFGERIE